MTARAHTGILWFAGLFRTLAHWGSSAGGSKQTTPVATNEILGMASTTAWWSIASAPEMAKRALVARIVSSARATPSRMLVVGS